MPNLCFGLGGPFPSHVVQYNTILWCCAVPLMSNVLFCFPWCEVTKSCDFFLWSMHMLTSIYSVVRRTHHRKRKTYSSLYFQRGCGPMVIVNNNNIMQVLLIMMFYMLVMLLLHIIVWSYFTWCLLCNRINVFFIFLSWVTGVQNKSILCSYLSKTKK